MGRHGATTFAALSVKKKGSLGQKLRLTPPQIQHQQQQLSRTRTDPTPSLDHAKPKTRRKGTVATARPWQASKEELLNMPPIPQDLLLEIGVVDDSPELPVAPAEFPPLPALEFTVRSKAKKKPILVVAEPKAETPEEEDRSQQQPKHQPATPLAISTAGRGLLHLVAPLLPVMGPTPATTDTLPHATHQAIVKDVAANLSEEERNILICIETLREAKAKKRQQKHSGSADGTVTVVDSPTSSAGGGEFVAVSTAAVPNTLKATTPFDYFASRYVVVSPFYQLNDQPADQRRFLRILFDAMVKEYMTAGVVQSFTGENDNTGKAPDADGENDSCSRQRQAEWLVARGPLMNSTIISYLLQSMEENGSSSSTELPVVPWIPWKTTLSSSSGVADESTRENDDPLASAATGAVPKYAFTVAEYTKALEGREPSVLSPSLVPNRLVFIDTEGVPARSLQQQLAPTTTAAVGGSDDAEKKKLVSQHLQPVTGKELFARLSVSVNGILPRDELLDAAYDTLPVRLQQHLEERCRHLVHAPIPSCWAQQTLLLSVYRFFLKLEAAEKDRTVSNDDKDLLANWRGASTKQLVLRLVERWRHAVALRVLENVGVVGRRQGVTQQRISSIYKAAFDTAASHSQQPVPLPGPAPVVSPSPSSLRHHQPRSTPTISTTVATPTPSMEPTPKPVVPLVISPGRPIPRKPAVTAPLSTPLTAPTEPKPSVKVPIAPTPAVAPTLALRPDSTVLQQEEKTFRGVPPGVKKATNVVTMENPSMPLQNVLMSYADDPVKHLATNFYSWAHYLECVCDAMVADEDGASGLLPGADTTLDELRVLAHDGEATELQSGDLLNAIRLVHAAEGAMVHEDDYGLDTLAGRSGASLERERKFLFDSPSDDHQQQSAAVTSTVSDDDQHPA